MTDTEVVQIGTDALLMCGKLAAPILMVALGVGLTIGLLQAATQLQEPTLTFVPKFLGVGIVLVVGGNWMLTEMVSFTRQMFDLVPKMLG